METNKVYNENCLDTMKRMLDESIDLVITSPPYDDLRNYHGYSFDFKSVAKELFRIIKKDSVVVWIVGDSTVKGSETGTSFKQALYFMECGFNLHDTMIYHKDNPVPVGGKNRYYQAFEYMFVFSKGKPKLNPIIVPRRNKWNDKRTVRHRAVSRDKDGEFVKKEVPIKENVKKTNVWNYVVSGGSSSTDKFASKHPAIFPERLVVDHIVSWSDEGDLLYDPFIGSGTTAKMALLNFRNFIGSEISSEYCDIAQDRIKLAYSSRDTMF